GGAHPTSRYRHEQPSRLKSSEPNVPISSTFCIDAVAASPYSARRSTSKAIHRSSTGRESQKAWSSGRPSTETIVFVSGSSRQGSSSGRGKKGTAGKPKGTFFDSREAEGDILRFSGGRHKIGRPAPTCDQRKTPGSTWKAVGQFP